MEPDTPMLPYETFMVEQYKYYRFRIVHAGMMFAFRISVDKVKYEYWVLQFDEQNDPQR